MQVLNKIDTAFTRYFFTISFTYFLEIILIIYISQFLGYSITFLFVRFGTALLFFILAKFFIFKSKGDFLFEFRRFALLMILNIIIIQIYFYFIEVISELFFIVTYTILHGILFVLNYLIQNYRIFLRLKWLNFNLP